MKYLNTIYIVAFAVFVLSLSGCISGPTNPATTNVSTSNTSTISEKTSASGNTTSTVPDNTTSSNSTPSLTNSPTIKCEICHTNPQNLTPHVNGGKYCINCHGSQVHNIHVGEGTVNLDCKTCHGFPPKIPTVQKGEGPGHYVVCENCHAAPPDNLKPSLGNLIVVHLSRGKYCTNCHGTDISAIHAAALANLTNRTR